MTEPVVLALKYATGKKTWVARITGRDRKYGLARDFRPSLGGKNAALTTGRSEYLLEDGIYEVCEADARSFLRVKGGQAEPMERVAVWKILLKRATQRKKARKKAAEEIDNGIARFNTEGGFNVGPSDN